MVVAEKEYHADEAIRLANSPDLIKEEQDVKPEAIHPSVYIMLGPKYTSA